MTKGTISSPSKNPEATKKTRERKGTKTAGKKRAQRGSVFAGVAVLLVARSPTSRQHAWVDLSKKRAALLAEKIEQNGGKVVYEHSPEVTHVVCSENISEDVLAQILPKAALETIAVHTPDWIPHSLRNGCPLDKHSFQCNAAQTLLNPEPQLPTTPTPSRNDHTALSHSRSRSRSLESLSLSSADELDPKEAKVDNTGTNSRKSLSKSKNRKRSRSPSFHLSDLSSDEDSHYAVSTSHTANMSDDDGQNWSDSGAGVPMGDGYESDPEYREQMRQKREKSERPKSNFRTFGAAPPKSDLMSILGDTDADSATVDDFRKAWTLFRGAKLEDSEEGQDDEGPSDLSRFTYAEEESKAKSNPSHALHYADSSVKVPAPKTKSAKNRSKHLACQIENPGNRVNYNAHVTDLLGKLEEIYRCIGGKEGQWREYAYRKAGGIVRRYPKKLETKEDVDTLLKTRRGIGRKLARKITEIVHTGTLRKLNELNRLPQIQTLKLFGNIWGVGPATAQRLYTRGIRTLDELRGGDLLTDKQRIGLKHYDDFLQRIPREEAVEIEKLVKKVCNEIVPDGQLKVVLCGSYRRGRPSCGDVDFLVTHENRDLLDGLCVKIVNRLTEIGLLTDHLSFPTGRGEYEHDSYMGVCKLKDRKWHRRIDIKVYQPESFPFALLYFTGSDHFNRSMRWEADKRGFTLSDHHLAPAVRRNKEKIWNGNGIFCRTERDVFKALGLRYIEPTMRNTFENFGPDAPHNHASAEETKSGETEKFSAENDISETTDTIETVPTQSVNFDDPGYVTP